MNRKGRRGANALRRGPPARSAPRPRRRSSSTGGADAVLIGIGANLNRPGLGPLARRPALAAIRLARAGLRPVRLSPLYRARSWPGGLGPRFVNAVALVRTRLAPTDILERLLAIERVFGRRRSSPGAPRPLDLDLLAVGGRVTGEGSVPALPHPRMRARAFVLRPLLDVLPAWRHPVDGTPLGALLARAPRRGDAWIRRSPESQAGRR